MTHVDWHPYPEELPNNGYVHIVTAKEINGWLFTALGFYDFDFDFWTDENNYKLDVVAWAELPEPYRPEVNDD